MRRLAIAVFLCLALGACAPEATMTTLNPAQAEITAQAALWPTATPEPTPIGDGPRTRWNYLVLGGDLGPGRPKEAFGGAGDKTDVMLLVSVNLGTPSDVAVVQFPRNLYAPWSGGERFMFEVYRADGPDGVRSYFLDVLGLDLDGMVYVDMAHFVELVDGLGGVDVGYFDLEQGETMAHFDGVSLLAWLRDNDNNWGHGVYDADNRQHKALLALGMTAWEFAGEDPVKATQIAWDLRDAFETDLGLIGIAEATALAAQVYQSGWTVRFERLASPDVERGPVPMEPGRGEVPTRDLRLWMAEVLDP